MKYNSSLRSRPPLRHQQNKTSSFFVPFIIIICLGIIGVLGFKLYVSLTDPEPQKGVAFELISGTAEMKAWGTDQFVDIPSGSFLMEGDELISSDDALMTMEFPDGTMVRALGGTDFVLEELTLDEEPLAIKIMLVHGQLWVNKMYKNTEKTDIQVSMGHVIVKSSDSSIMDLENKIDEVVRVISGASVNVDVMNENKTKVVEPLIIGVGQEVKFTNEVLAQFWKFESPSILTALTDDFRDGEWYKFNVSADKTPGNIASLSSPLESVSTSETTEVLASTENTTVESVVAENTNPVSSAEVSSTLAVPTITSVSGGTKVNENGFYVVTNYLATLTGTAPGASEVYVNDYKLQKFVAGASSWTYFANAKYDLMKEGENTYKVYSKDSSGKKSAELVVKVLYKPTPVVSQPVVTTQPEIVSVPPAPAPEPELTPVVETEMPDWLK